MSNKANKLWIATLLVSAGLVALALTGGNWTASAAAGITCDPGQYTIPAIETMTKPFYFLYEPGASLEFTGTNFIPEDPSKGWVNGPYTMVKMTELGSSELTVWLTPVKSSLTPAYLKTILPGKVMDHASDWDVVVINHTGEPAAECEASAHYQVKIDYFRKLYLPIVDR